MHIERAQLRETLKCGDKVWGKGTIFDSKDGRPIPREIIAEVRAKTGLVEVLGPERVDPEKIELPPEPEVKPKKLSRAEVSRMTKPNLLKLVKNEPDFKELKKLKKPYLLKAIIKRLF